MPGFNIGGIGGTRAYGPEAPRNTMELSRSYRWIIKRLGPRDKPFASNELLIAREVTLPKFRPEKVEILGGTKTYKYVKNVKWDDTQVIMYDNALITWNLTQWRNMIYLEQEGLNIHDEYKGLQEFEEIDGAGNSITNIKLYGGWPVSIDWGKLSYTDTSIKVCEFSLSYDWAIVIKVGNYGSKQPSIEAAELIYSSDWAAALKGK
jgi:hypothetical protein